MLESYTVTEFAAKMDLNETYVRHGCNGYINPKTGRRYRLPAGYVAKKEGPGNTNRKQWIIYRATEQVEIPLALEGDYEQNLYKIRKDELLKSGCAEAIADRSAREYSWSACYQFYRLAMAISPEGFNGIPFINGKKSHKQRSLDTLNRVLDRDLKLRRDADLANECAVRWRYRVRYVTPDDLTERERPFDVGQDLQHAEDLFHIIRECYRTAVLWKKTVKIELAFEGTGNWGAKLLNRDEPGLELWLRSNRRLEHNYWLFGNSLKHLFASVWFDDIWMQKKAKEKRRDINQVLNRPEIQEHPWNDELLKRCINCGKTRRQNKRPFARFCDESCKSAYSDWIKNQVHHNNTDIMKSIGKKIAKLSKVLAAS